MVDGKMLKELRRLQSGEVEPGLNDDSTALHTAAAGIKMLCNYGKRQDVERAQEIADLVEALVARMRRHDGARRPGVEEYI